MNVWLAALFLIEVVWAAPKCHDDKVYDCVRDFAKYENMTSSVFPELSEESVRKICSEYVTVDKCLAPMRSACETDQKYIYMGVDGSFQYVCTEQNLQTYLKHSHCLGDVNLKIKGYDCLTDFYIAFYLLYDESQICGYMEDHVDCIKEHVEKECGTEIAEWQYDVNTHYLSALVEDYDCEFGKVHLNSKAVAGIVSAVIIGVVLTILIVMVACRRQIFEKINSAKAENMRMRNYRRQNEAVASAERGRPTQSEPSAAYDYSLPYNQGTRVDAGDNPANAYTISGDLSQVNLQVQANRRQATDNEESHVVSNGSHVTQEVDITTETAEADAKHKSDSVA